MRRLAVLVCATASIVPLAAASAQADKLVSFLSPSRNIACILDSGSSFSDARCDIHKHTWKLGRPKGCVNLNYGDSLSVGLHGRGFVTCHGDTTFATYPVLGYGRSKSDGPFTCSSAVAGITCTNRRTHHGFLISRTRIKLF
jgi:hypothetical protein